MGQDAAAKKGTELLLDETGSGLLSASRACEEGLEVLAYDLVEQGSLRLVALVLDGVGPWRDRVLHGNRSNFGADSAQVVKSRSRPPLPTGSCRASQTLSNDTSRPEP